MEHFEANRSANKVLRDRLIANGVALACLHEAELPSLIDTAQSSEIAETTAFDIFGSDAAFQQELFEFVKDRFHHYVSANLAGLTNEAQIEETITVCSRGYFQFCTEEPTTFGAFVNLTRGPNFTRSSELSELDFSRDPAFGLAVDLTAKEFELRGEIASSWSIIVTAFAVYATIHGAAYQSVFGATRHLSRVAKRQTLNGVLDNIVAGTSASIYSGTVPCLVPQKFVGSTDFPPIPAAIDMPRSTDTEKRTALFRGAIEVVCMEGPDALTPDRAVKQAGLSQADVSPLLEAAEPIGKQLERQINRAELSLFDSQCRALPPNSTTINMIKAIGFGYLAYGLSDPAGFKAITLMSTSSIVPASFDSFEENFEISGSFAALLDVVRQAISDGGGPRSTWVLYEQAMALWSIAFGLAHLFSLGCMRDVDKELKFELTGLIMDIGLEGMNTRLELKSPTKKL